MQIANYTDCFQAQAVQLEKETATRLLELDRRISKPAIIDKRAKKTPEPFPAKEERQLYLSEVNLNGAMDAATFIGLVGRAVNERWIESGGMR